MWPWPEVPPPPATLAGSTSELSFHDPPCALHLKSPTVPGFSVRIKVQCRKHPFSSMRKHPRGAVDSPRFKPITQVMWSWQRHLSGLNLSVPSIRHRSRPLPRLMRGVKWDNARESTVHVWHSLNWVNLYDSKPMDGRGNTPLPCDSGLAYSTWTRMLDWFGSHYAITVTMGVVQEVMPPTCTSKCHPCITYGSMDDLASLHGRLMVAPAPSFCCPTWHWNLLMTVNFNRAVVIYLKWSQIQRS